MQENETGIEMIWGINAIAKMIGRTDRQAFHMASTGQIPARKVGGRWCAERGELIAFFKGKAAA